MKLKITKPRKIIVFADYIFSTYVSCISSKFTYNTQVQALLLDIHFPGEVNITFPATASIYLLKVNNRNTRTMCVIWSKLTINTLERRQWRRSGVLIDSFEQISYIAKNVGWLSNVQSSSFTETLRKCC